MYHYPGKIKKQRFDKLKTLHNDKQKRRKFFDEYDEIDDFDELDEYEADDEEYEDAEEELATEFLDFMS